MIGDLPRESRSSETVGTVRVLDRAADEPRRAASIRSSVRERSAGRSTMARQRLERVVPRRPDVLDPAGGADASGAGSSA